MIYSSCREAKEKTRMDQQHAVALESKHAGLDRQIEDEERRPHPDEIRLAQLKKEKLRIKDQLAFH